MIKTVALIFWLLFAAAGAVRADSADRWLERMSRAAQTLNYQGDFVFLRGDQMRQMQALHLVDEAGEHVRITTVDGPPTQIFAHGGQVTVGEKGGTRKLPGSREVLFSSSLPQRLLALKSLYTVSLGAPDRVAGRPAQIIDVQPRDDFRFGFQLWADREHGLLLKAVMINREGRAVERFSFSRIDLNPDPDQPIETTDYSVAQSGVSVASEPQPGSRWEVTEVPPGFALQSVSRHADEQQTEVDHLLFSDGLATVSVFVEPIGDNPMPENRSTSKGGVSAMMGRISQNQVTVMGEVPTETLSLILRSIKPVESGHSGRVHD